MRLTMFHHVHGIAHCPTATTTSAIGPVRMRCAGRGDAAVRSGFAGKHRGVRLVSEVAFANRSDTVRLGSSVLPCCGPFGTSAQISHRSCSSQSTISLSPIFSLVFCTSGDFFLPLSRRQQGKTVNLPYQARSVHLGTSSLTTPE